MARDALTRALIRILVSSFDAEQLLAQHGGLLVVRALAEVAGKAEIEIGRHGRRHWSWPQRSGVHLVVEIVLPRDGIFLAMALSLLSLG